MNPSHPPSVRPQVVAVFGLGYVGCVTAACLSQMGHRVIGVEKDGHKIRAVQAGQPPFYEPGLGPLIEQNVASGRLSATTDVAEGIADAHVALICVGTPSQRDGNLTLDFLQKVAVDIKEALPRRREKKPLIVAVRSTVFPGTCDEVVGPVLGAEGCPVVMHPEFMREGSAVRDFEKPPLLIFGGSDRAALEQLACLYAALDVEPCFVSIRTAEMIKYACNAFHALKVGFANEVGALCSDLGIDGKEVMATLCRDTVLNISPAYMKPGPPFGGSCLPKDLRALVYRARHRDLKLTLLESILPSNDEHLRRAIQRVLDLPEGRIGMFGLAFKENTDDLRESPVVGLLEHLIGKGRDVGVFDPHIRLEDIYGTNRSFVLAAVPHIARLLHNDLDQLLSWADHVVVTQKPTPEFQSRIEQSGRTIVNLT